MWRCNLFKGNKHYTILSIRILRFLFGRFGHQSFFTFATNFLFSKTVKTVYKFHLQVTQFGLPCSNSIYNEQGWGGVQWRRVEYAKRFETESLFESNRSINRRINRNINRSINRSIDRLINREKFKQEK